MLDISIRSKKYNCSFTLQDKITVIVGDSGVGKSLFVKAVTDQSGAYKIKISDNYLPRLITNNSWQDILSLNVAESRMELLIVDDEDFVFKKEFGEAFTKVTNSYFVFIVRTEVNKSRLSSWNGISISANAIFEFVKDGKEHTVKPASKYKVVDRSNCRNIDFCLCEDKQSGFVFFKRVFKDVKSSEGKDSILSYIRDNENLFKYKSIYLVVDFAAIGFKLREIIAYLSKLGCHVYFSSEYQSFEYLILRSNFFGISKESIRKDVLKFISLEDKCTQMLQEITKGKIYTYNKGDVPLCFTDDCCKMNRAKMQCDKGMKGDKLTALLQNTEFDFLLSIRQV